MSTELLLREHFVAVADEVLLAPAGVDIVTGRVRRGRALWGFAAAAVLAAAVAISVVAVSDGQELTAPPAEGFLSGPGLDWGLVLVASDAGPVSQLITGRDGGFLLLTETQRWFRSQDGIAWAELQPSGFGSAVAITMVANTGNRLVAAGTDSGGRPVLATSLDGVVWEGASPDGSGSRGPVSIASIGDTVVVPFLDGSFESVVYRFTVEDLWTRVEPPESNVQVLAVGALGDVFVAQVTDPAGGFPHRDYRSSDGIDWEDGSPIPMIQVNKPLTHPIVAGPDGWYLTSFGLDNEHKFMKSTDGVTWQPVVDTAFEFGPPLLSGGDSGILAVLPISSDPGSGALAQVLFSQDGDTWEVQDLGEEFDAAARWVAGALNNEVVVIGGAGFEGGAPRDDDMETVVWVADR